MASPTVEAALHLKLANAGHAAPSADNSQPWHYYWDGSALIVEYDHKRVQGLTFPPQAPATLLSIGGVVEHMWQAAETLKVPITLDIFPQECATPGCYARIAIQAEGHSADSNLKQHVLYGRHTNRFRFSTKPIPTDMLQPLEQMSQNSACTAVLVEKDAISTAAKLVRSASEVRFQTQEIHEWLGQSLRFPETDVKIADGLDIRTLDLPPGGRLFLKFISDWRRIRLLNKIGIYKILANIDAAPLKRVPVVVAVIGENTPTGALDAGRLLSRTWIHLNSLGLAVHPYFVVSDQIFRLQENTVPPHLVSQIQDVDRETRELFDLADNQVLYMLLRVGYPTRKAPRSLRLPLEKVFTDLSQSHQD